MTGSDLREGIFLQIFTAQGDDVVELYERYV